MRTAAKLWHSSSKNKNPKMNEAMFCFAQLRCLSKVLTFDPTWCILATMHIKGPYQRSYMSLSSVNIGLTDYTNPTQFSPNIFIYEIWNLFTFCLYSAYFTESTWKCVTMLVKKNVSKSFITLLFELGRQELFLQA